MQQQQLMPGIGEHVITSDGEILGEVAEIQGHHFKVDVSWGRDYWLSFSGVDVVEDGAVCLSFPKENLKAQKVSAPV